MIARVARQPTTCGSRSPQFDFVIGQLATARSILLPDKSLLLARAEPSRAESGIGNWVKAEQTGGAVPQNRVTQQRLGTELTGRENRLRE